MMYLISSTHCLSGWVVAPISPFKDDSPFDVPSNAHAGTGKPRPSFAAKCALRSYRVLPLLKLRPNLAVECEDPFVIHIIKMNRGLNLGVGGEGWAEL